MDGDVEAANALGEDELEDGEDVAVEEVVEDVFEEDVAVCADGSLAHAARRRLRVLQRQVEESQSAIVDDRDMRRPGWQAADARAGLPVQPSADEQRAGLGWLRATLEARLAVGCGTRRLAVLRGHVGEAAIIDLRAQVASLKADRRLELKARLKNHRRR